MSKAYPEEKVGVFAVRDGCTEVVEYSELDPSEASATDPGEHRSSLPSLSPLKLVSSECLDCASGDPLLVLGIHYPAERSL